MEAAERKEILRRYIDHSRRFEEVGKHRSGASNGELIPFARPLCVQRELSAREIEVLQLISDGLGNEEIGARLFISMETVKTHVRHLLAKLEADSRAHAVALGFRHKLIA